MKKVLPVALFLGNFFFSVTAFGQSPISFTNSNNRLNNANFHSGVAISVADMDGDGLDDIARMDNGYDLYMEVQKTGGKFTTVPAISTGSSSAWSMVVGDADNNGRKDVAVGFGSSAKVVMSDNAFSNFTISTLPNSNYFLQNMSFADIDNDGWIDIWGCNDVGTSKMWGNNGSGGFPATTNFFSPATYPASDNSGNYGNIFTDFDNDGDVDMYVAHCRQGVNSSTDPRRINQLFINNGTTYVLDSFNTRGLNSGAQTWTSSFEDIDNDGDFDCLLTNHDVPSVILRNNGSGYFTDITASTGFDIGNVTPIQSKMEDFDNDGYVDILITGGDEVLFRNNGNGTFTEVLNAFDNNDMESFAIGDLNHDGKIDVYGGYANIYTTPTNVDDVVWLNTTENNNHFITFVLQGTVSNRDALGAKVRIYGSFGQQVREVRAGESYGTTNTFHLHFGLGSATMVDSAVVYWPSGQTTTLLNRPADQFITVIEGQCASLDNIVTSVGPAVLCPGQTVTLSAVAGATYLWSTNETTQNITVDTAGEYNVKVIFGNGCSSTSKTIAVTVNPDETPTIMPVTETVFCQGSSIQLTSNSPAEDFTWSNGDTSHITTITAPGSYTLTIQGACAPYTSAPINVTMISSDVSAVTPAASCGEGSVTLGATTTGTAHWFADAAGTTELTTGSTFTTPVLTSDVTYYVQSFDTVMGLGGNVGPVDTLIGAGGMFNGNQAQIFTVMKPCILRTVKVFAGGAGARTIQLRASDNTTVLQSAIVNLPAGESIVTLNFPLAVGSNFRLGWANNSNPNLYRNSDGGNYPYDIANLISITGNTANSLDRWYAYYDWRVEELPTTCISTIDSVTASINAVPTAAISGLNANYFNNDAPVTLTGTPAGGTFSGPGVSGSTFNPANAGVGGPYEVIYNYTDVNGCSAADTTQVSVSLFDDINTIGFNKGFEMFPNPTNGIVNIKSKEMFNGPVEIQVYDITGKLISSRNVTMDNSNVTTIDLTTLAKGLYNLKITHNNQSHTVKVSLQ